MGKKAKKKAKEEQAIKDYLELLSVLSLQSSHEEVNDSMNISISRLANFAALLAFGAAAFGNVVFGLEGLELLAAGLGLHAGGDLLEDVLS